MPTWFEYKEIAKARGSLALELFVVESQPAGPPEAIQNALPDHLAYQLELEKSGYLVFAGPVSDKSGEQMQGGGMIIYRAIDMGAARSLTENDPMHKTGARSFVLRKWLINECSPKLLEALTELRS